MAKLAWCGLGQMGVPMVTRLLGAGNDVVVWNRTPSRAIPLVERGARVAGSPAEAAAGCEVVFTMVSGPAALGAVSAGDDGVVAGLAGGATLVEMSTVGPTAIEELAARLGPDVDLLDAPVLGSVAQATEGTLKIFVGGDSSVIERRRPLLEILGQPVHIGASGAGAAMKLVTNSTLMAAITALGEALALGDALGLDQSSVLEVLAGSPLGATVKSKGGHIQRGDYPANFKLSLAAKDAGLVLDAAEGAGIALQVASAARAWLQAAEEAGLGDDDYSAVIACIRRQGQAT